MKYKLDGAKLVLDCGSISPDITPLDFFLLEYIEHTVYKTPIWNSDKWKNFALDFLFSFLLLTLGFPRGLFRAAGETKDLLSF